MTDGQEQALRELRRMASANPGLVLVREWEQPDGLFVDVSIDCTDLRPANIGLPLRARERLIIRVPSEFPFEHPTVRTLHTRWAGTTHVQWGRHLCLYVSPSVEWDPSDGMAGLVERLILWLERAAAGELDAPGEPLHPPVAYASDEAGTVVVRANAPRAGDGVPWLGIALLHQVTDDRVDLVGWRGLADPWPATLGEARLALGLGADRGSPLLAFAVMLPRAIAFEYPATARELVQGLAEYGVDEEVMLGMIGVAANVNRGLGRPDGEEDGNPAPASYLVVGTPTRGVVGATERLTHLAAWRLPPFAEQIARLVPKRHSKVPEIAELGREILKIGREWLSSSKTAWARVYEARSEIVTPRDAETSAAWLTERKVLVLGAGALGAPIAEACVRGGASRVVVADRGVVNPGILVRQPYSDLDIGHAKALVLAERLDSIRPDVTVEPWVGDVVATMFEDGSPAPDFDLVIDATADRTVRLAIEHRRAMQRDVWPPLVTVLIGHDARRGIATISRVGSSGAGADILRRLSLAARADATGALSDVVDDFFPDPPRSDFFQPEPGCSDVTFIGSAADVTGLAGQLLTGALHALVSDERGDDPMLALAVRATPRPGDVSILAPRWFRWPNDLVAATEDGRYELRVALPALAEMRAEARHSARVRAEGVETGGTLLGGFDSAVGVVWVDEATGPPPDSWLSEEHFDHGIEGVEEYIAARRIATARVTTFVGMWHSHPFGRAWPSTRDENGMQELVLPLQNAPIRALLLILGGQSDVWRSWLDTGAAPRSYARVVERAGAGWDAPSSASASAVRLGVRAWRGGSRTPETGDDVGRGSWIRRWLPWRRKGSNS